MERFKAERTGLVLGEFLAERMEEEVLDNYKVEENKREAFRGRSAPFEWRRVRKHKKYRMRKWCEHCWASNFLFV